MYHVLFLYVHFYLLRHIIWKMTKQKLRFYRQYYEQKVKRRKISVQHSECN